MNINETKIILASSSPRRIQMMKEHGIQPLIIPPDVDETLPDGLSMEQAVMFLALKKALAVEAELLSMPENSETIITENPVIIAADTVVYKDGIIGKPETREEAFEILAKLRKSNHFVATGVCLLQAGTTLRRTFCEITRVYFNDYSDQIISDYVNTQEPYDKAGGYAIQGTWAPYVHHIEGDFNNVVGFPWDRILVELERF